jgi:aromatic ring hydroxylase
MIKHYIADKVDRLTKDFVAGGIKAYKKLIFCQYLGYVVEIICGMASSQLQMQCLGRRKVMVEFMNCMVAGCNSVKSTITKACDPPTHHKGPTHYQTICTREVVVQVFDIIWSGLRCCTTGKKDRNM